ncbi:MAG: ornithine cyclodeaminase family protein [Vicinamibacterales bacterium]|jgi:ornithine cyclodeaminase|nr:ornithine cyclodeaminase [Acidobacteriota bacterium]MDP7471736.1 ornithine cyclodeaminase family protein [Vicinamibacterales bacterium]MDP7672364.1 ornithine cyclodeaminase family protein [Vicinamibacterales bacterium]HJO37941.1 ornithine cyclodeaminase family protein [Vicinamibacterales bacterium]|tara:strand:- start:181 stop:1164 length:984 start_codon:yes stop_codon:yes gene_type:complete
MPLILPEEEVRALISIPDLVPVMERTLGQFSAGEVDQPLRSVLGIGRDRSFCGVMAAALDDPAAVGTKLITIVERNHERGLPSHLATVVLLDPETGALLALLDGRYITEARTPAVSAMAARQLATSGGGHTLAILGSGVQARSHLEAFSHTLDVETARVWSPNASHRERFVETAAASSGVSITAASSAEEAVREATLVVLATSSAVPVLDSAWVADGAHVTSVGAPVPDQREMDPQLVARARVIVDSRAAALAESGDIVQGIAEGHFEATQIAGEIGEIVNGTLRGRTSPSEVTVFKSLGMAVEDIAAAHLAYTRAREQGRGVEIDL